MFEPPLVQVRNTDRQGQSGAPNVSLWSASPCLDLTWASLTLITDQRHSIN